MIRSMTGFGKATREKTNQIITVEIRSLNSKGADVSLRVPSSLRNHEPELRSELSKQLERGKIDLSVFIESNTPELQTEINLPLAKAYYEQLRNLSLEIGQPVENVLAQILKFPDVLKSAKEDADEGEIELIRLCIADAVESLNAFREKEGASLFKDFEVRIGKIASHLDEIKKLDVLRLKSIKERIRNNIEEMLEKSRLDENRFEQELIYYVEKLDINEEKVRLQTHLDYFMETCREKSPGRKLAFISQEIGREINTIGSKANDAQIQRHVVLMKDELEKIKEQALNVL